MEKKVTIPIVDGKYQVMFPNKCVYCGAPAEIRRSRTASSKVGRRTYYATVEVPYCQAHARESKRNARILTIGFISVLLLSCCGLFGITTSIDRNPSTTLMIVLAMVAFGLAYGGRLLLRNVMARRNPSMAAMIGGNLGVRIQPFKSEIIFTFANDQIADEFARLNDQEVNK